MGNHNISPAVSPDVRRTHPQFNCDINEETDLQTVAQLSPGKRKILESKITVLKEFDSAIHHSKSVEDYFDPGELGRQLFKFDKKSNEIRLAVKIFLSSAAPSLATNVAKLLNPINKNIKFGAVHAGLQIGDVVIDWNQIGLVHIGELKFAKAAVLFDTRDAIKVSYTEDLERRIISLIQTWNTSYEYSAKYNSHLFVSEFLQQTIGLSLMGCFEGPLGKYIAYVREHGDSTPRLFSKYYGELVFNSHEELEQIEKERKEDVSEKKWHKLTIEEINLMKVFHRGFQLQEAAAGKDISQCCHGLLKSGLEIFNDEKLNLEDSGPLSTNYYSIETNNFVANWFDLRYTRVKDVGNKSQTASEQRNRRIVAIAKPLPEGYSLPGRAMYWLVTTEKVEIDFQDHQLFKWKESVTFRDEQGVLYYLNQIDFQKNKHGVLTLIWPIGSVQITCYSTARKNKRQKLTHRPITLVPQFSNEFDKMQVEEYQLPYLQNNADQFQWLTIDNSFSNSNSSEYTPELKVNNPRSSGSPLVANILMLVPHKDDLMQKLEQIFQELDYIKEVASNTLHLYNQNLINYKRNILLFTYGDVKHLFKIQDYLHHATEVMLLIENEADQEKDLMVIQQVNNINHTNNSWSFMLKGTSLTPVIIDFQNLKPEAQNIFAIKKLKESALGGVSWKKSFENDQFASSFKWFFIQWTLEEGKGNTKETKDIYMCF